MNRLIIDTETLGSVKKADERRVYDFGAVIVDSKFHVEKTYRALVAETWRGDFGDMSSAYYKRKLPIYHEMVEKGELPILPFLTIFQDITKICKDYKIKEVWAYNASFDRDSLNATLKACSNGFRSYFIPYGTKWYCIHHVAVQTILNHINYINFAFEHNFITKNECPQSTAESAFAYITKNASYKEEHTALADALIESVILQKCYSNARGHWRKVNKEPSNKVSFLMWDNFNKRVNEYFEKLDNCTKKGTR